MREAKDFNENTYTSITAYFLDGTACKYSSSGYTAFECITSECVTCNGLIAPPKLDKTCASDKVATYYQYQPVEYVNKKGKRGPELKGCHLKYRLVNAKRNWMEWPART